MNDDHFELRRRLASAAPVTDSQVAALDLRDAEDELLEEIMATTDTADDTGADSARVLDLHGQPSGPDRRHAGFRVAVAAAAVAALAGGLLLTRADTSGPGEGSSEVAGLGAPDDDVELPRLTPGDVPDELEIEEFVLYGQASGWDYAAFFGQPAEGGDEGDLANVDLIIQWSVANADSTRGPNDGYTPTPVRDHDGYACEGDACTDTGPDVQARVQWPERPGVYFSMSSPSLTAAQLVAIADGLEIGGHDVGEDDVSAATFVIGADEVDLGAVPDDVTVELADLGRRTYAAEGPGTEVTYDENGQRTTPHPPPDFLHFWYRAADPTEALTIAVEKGEGYDIAARLAEGGGERTDDVRGHPAWAFTLPPNVDNSGVERRSIVWEEEPGVLVTIETFGTDYDVDVLRDVAESLHEPDAQEWQALLDVSDAQGSD